MTRPSSSLGDVVAIAVCTLVWGTTWYAITMQLGIVEPMVSVVWRFTLAGVVLMAWGVLRRAPLGLTRAQHVAAAGVGVTNFAIQYPLVYLAEAHLASAVVAVMFAASSFFNLVAFRFSYGQRASLAAWIASGMGVAGVALLSWGEILTARMDARAVTGLLITLAAVVVSACSNLFARRVEITGASVIASTAWAMLYGAGVLAAFATLRGAHWAFDPRPAYVFSLAYLTLAGSVIAFLLYYGLARRRGFATASYIAALTPLVAMVVSTALEGKRWNVFAFAGVAVIVAGQWLMLRTARSRETAHSD